MGLFRMPSLGSDMEAGTLIEWTVAPGDTVARGDVVAVVETQKGAIEIETFEAGTVHELIAELGQTLPVGEPLAQIGAEGEAVAPTPEPEVPPVAAAKPDPQPIAPPVATGGAGASPAARRAAQEAGIELASLKGSGPGGAVVLADVEAGAKPKPADTLSAMRKAVAAAMTRSKQEIPHFQVTQSIDTQALSDWLAARNADCPPAERLLPGAAYLKAAALAASTVKALNGRFEEGGFHPSAEVNIGVAIALRGGGLVAPALAGVDRMTLNEVMAGMRDLVSRARAGRLRASEFTRGTLTVSSLGEGGAEAMSGIIFPPQVGLLAIGSPQVRPWIVDGKIEPREITAATLSADHRVADGRQASRFLMEFADRLSKPELL